MLYLLTKALISGVIIAIVSEVAKRSPAFAALIVSLPLTSILAFVWIWRDESDPESIAALSLSTFWFVLPTMPMFLVIPVLLRVGVGFWSSLIVGCALTIVLYLAMVWALSRLGISL